MPRAKLVLGLVLVGIAALNVWAFQDERSWPTLAARVEQSLVRVSYPVTVFENPFTDRTGIRYAACTGISIDRARGHFLTALHCLNEGSVHDVSVDRTAPASLIYRNPLIDTAVIRAKIQKPELWPEKVTVRGQDAGTLGYAYGMDEITFKPMHIAASRQQFPEWLVGESAGVVWIELSQPVVAGMSGGPVFDRNGQLLGMLMRTDEAIGLAVPIETILKYTLEHWSPEIQAYVGDIR